MRVNTWEMGMVKCPSSAGPNRQNAFNRGTEVSPGVRKVVWHEYALNRLSMDSTPLVTLTFLEVPSPQAVSSQLARSVERAFGVQLLQEDAPLRYSLSVLSRELVRLGPTRLAVLWSNYCPQLVNELGRTLGNQVQLISIAHDSEPFIDLPSNFVQIDQSALRVSEGEAVVAAGESLNPAEAVALISACGGHFGEFISKVDSTLVLRSFWSLNRSQGPNGMPCLQHL